MPERKRYKPWIWRRLLIMLLLCSLLPLVLLGLLTVLTPSSGVSELEQPGQQVVQESSDQFERLATVHARGIQARLSRTSYSVKLLAEYASQVLSAPDIFAAQVVPNPGAVSGSPAASGSTADASAGEVVPAPLDNPLFYSVGADGAVRKLINDNRPAVYFARPGSGSFTAFDLQRLHASAVLDPLLMEPVKDPLCAQSFIITRDNLCRTYPFRDFSLWPADKDLAKPRDFWSALKADDNGILWTAPYFSSFTNTWVIACMSAISAGDRLIAVAGCEVDLVKLSEELMSFSLGNGGSCWLLKPIPVEGDQPARLLLLACQDGARDRLGAVPLSSAGIPDDKHTGPIILAESDVLLHAKPEFRGQILAQLNIAGPSVAQMLPDTTVSLKLDDSAALYLMAAPVKGLGWILGGEAPSPATLAVTGYVQSLQGATSHRLLILFIALFSGVVLAFIVAWFEARRITQPLLILGQQARQAAASRKTSSVALSDEGEIGALAQAVQELIDATTEPRNGSYPNQQDLPLAAPVPDPDTDDVN